MTIEDLIRSELVFVNPADIAGILHCDAQQIRVEARREPCRLGFPVVVVGHRVRIPREAFLKYLKVI